MSQQVKFLRRVDSCACPRCSVVQTIFIYFFDAAGQKMNPDEDVINPLNSAGFICVKCKVPITGAEFYRAAGLTVGDIK